MEKETPCTEAEREFIAAIDTYKRENRRPFPTWSEVFVVFTKLGYTRGTKPTAGDASSLAG
jgi:hypothetical protein